MPDEGAGAFCLRFRRWARWAPLLYLVARVLGQIPSWAVYVTPCSPGWRHFRARLWLRLVPRGWRGAVSRRLPQWATAREDTPDCASCARLNGAEEEE